jgi:malonate decarboxylase delta subunit
MEHFTFTQAATARLGGTGPRAIVGVVASGNLEVLAERNLDDAQCAIEVATASVGFRDVWQAVFADFVARWAPGGVRFSVNDSGARPDTVTLRLMQAARALESA